jgi:hypothetical protein
MLGHDGSAADGASPSGPMYAILSPGERCPA